ncbi:hypothetical protein N1851_017159 [Merluccius polli]|uniref:Uncharacterized protein n=1 Tax=Merluccius polli TaxID=89951 RepID=A0AA47NZ95_MERPO|nr:hypothetical protein N1851_017159 [Merluccius polli]
MEDELDMDELYNENCVLQDVLRNLEINSHSVGELWAQALRSRSAFPQYAKLLSFILSIPRNKSQNEFGNELHKYILGKTGMLAAVKSSAKYGDVPPQPRVGLVLDEESASCSSREAEDSECAGSAAGRDSSD